MGSSEDVLLMVSFVRHKKSDGIMYLMGERVGWMLDGKDTFAISIRYADVKIQKISPEGKPKIQLQIVQHNGDATTFHFFNPEGQEAQLKDRNDVKELLQQLLPKFKPKVNKELEEKQRILNEEPELYQLYRDLVMSQVISAEEFWNNYSSKKSKKASQKLHQDIGVSAAFLADIKPQTDGSNGLKYNITPDIIVSIFKTYPAVKKKHMEHVPHKLSESEFWTRFFQSHYFHRDRLNLGSKDLFSECAKSDENDIKSALQNDEKDPFVNINNFNDAFLEEGYGSTSASSNSTMNSASASRNSQVAANQAMIRRFNHHSMMVLQACSESRTTASENSDGTPVENGPVSETVTDQNGHKVPQGDDQKSVKKRRLDEKLDYEDLSSSGVTQVPPLNLHNLERYLHGPTPIQEIDDDMEDQSQSVEILKELIGQWEINSSQALQSKAAISALGELSRGGALMASTSQQTLKDNVPVEVQKELKQMYSALCELLRHFWSCFPANTPQLEEKVLQMRSTLERFQYAKLQPFHDFLVKSHYSGELTLHLHNMLQAAYNKFDIWHSKSFNKKIKRL